MTKKWTALLLAAVLAVGLSACDTSRAEAPGSNLESGVSAIEDAMTKRNETESSSFPAGSDLRIGTSADTVATPDDFPAAYNYGTGKIEDYSRTAMLQKMPEPVDNATVLNTSADPTLRKTAQDRATQVAEADVIEEIESRLKKLRREEPFAGLHVCPASSLDVPDEQAARLVILRTEDTHRANAGASAAITAAENILNNHGSKPRTYRNMLAFVAPDQEAMLSLRQAVRDFRAWRSIQDDKETLNLDAAQNKEVDANLHRCNDTVEARIKETYCWLLTPEIDCFVDMKTIQWDASRISGGTDSIVAKASRKMQQSETLITKWAPALLLMELNNVLWKDTDCIQIKKLWEYLCTYCYLPRLAKYSVLEDAIRTGLNSQEYFALAAGYTGDRYVELRYNQFVDCINTSDLLVKLDPARKQLLAEKSAPAVVVQPTQTAQGGEQPTLFNLPPDAPIDPTVTLHQPPTAQPAAVPAPPKNTRFYMTAELDTTRINRDVQRLVEEVITHLLSADGCKVSVTLDVTADAPDGLSTPIVRTVMENCKTLKVKDFGVDE